MVDEKKEMVDGWKENQLMHVWLLDDCSRKNKIVWRVEMRYICTEVEAEPSPVKYRGQTF